MKRNKKKDTNQGIKSLTTSAHSHSSMSSMTEDCDTGIYGAKPRTNQRGSDKAQQRRTNDPTENRMKHKQKQQEVDHQRLKDKKIIIIFCSKDTIFSTCLQLIDTALHKNGSSTLYVVLIHFMIATRPNSCPLMSHRSDNYCTPLVN